MTIIIVCITWDDMQFRRPCYCWYSYAIRCRSIKLWILWFLSKNGCHFNRNSFILFDSFCLYVFDMKSIPYCAAMAANKTQGHRHFYRCFTLQIYDRIFSEIEMVIRQFVTSYYAVIIGLRLSLWSDGKRRLFLDDYSGMRFIMS